MSRTTWSRPGRTRAPTFPRAVSIDVETRPAAPACGPRSGRTDRAPPSGRQCTPRRSRTDTGRRGTRRRPGAAEGSRPAADRACPGLAQRISRSPSVLRRVGQVLLGPVDAHTASPPVARQRPTWFCAPGALAPVVLSASYAGRVVEGRRAELAPSGAQGLVRAGHPRPRGSVDLPAVRRSAQRSWPPLPTAAARRRWVGESSLGGAKTF